MWGEAQGVWFVGLTRRTGFWAWAWRAGHGVRGVDGPKAECGYMVRALSGVVGVRIKDDSQVLGTAGGTRGALRFEVWGTRAGQCG